MAYEQELKSTGPLDEAMNAKPYHAFSPNAAIVHFHGPKPTDYLAKVTANTCAFGKMCSQGLQRDVVRLHVNCMNSLGARCMEAEAYDGFTRSPTLTDLATSVSHGEIDDT
ncbi:hypothetical protein BE221DRAFT_143034 [Ostreococcus tauri]|uniref:Uncharacterized protein n=1 Tax=Ostreococcus tauri TaxID=70448 RepID=A0A1Y5HWM9_OSTTA|nr:hypothetical protein BE221DRAFT_143034 [Ostreococcus tauri]